MSLPPCWAGRITEQAHSLQHCGILARAVSFWNARLVHHPAVLCREPEPDFAAIQAWRALTFQATSKEPFMVAQQVMQLVWPGTSPLALGLFPLAFIG